MSVALQLILSASLVAAPSGCSWAHPGANPYRGDPAHALASFDLPEPTRQKLRVLMDAHRYTDVATITRDDIVGAHTYTGLREMHSGGGQSCHGDVDRSAWSAKHRERGLVYCADDACVIVPTVCNNVSLVSRKPDRVAESDDSPIDIEPAAGPTPVPADTPLAAPSTASPLLDFLPPPDAGGGAPGSPDMPVGGGGGIGGVGPIGGGIPCCDDTGPGVPTGPGTPPILAVPEAPTWALLLTGLALVFGRRRRRP